ncbi:DUF2797 domain-containing protein [Vibrio chagasii]|nr:DUF2797 domain-containing protein [Vibrio chagasii]
MASRNQEELPQGHCFGAVRKKLASCDMCIMKPETLPLRRRHLS